jgi:hypothetical protein
LVFLGGVAAAMFNVVAYGLVRLLLAKCSRSRDPSSVRAIIANFLPTRAGHIHGEFVKLRHAGKVCMPIEVCCYLVTSLQMPLKTPSLRVAEERTVLPMSMNLVAWLQIADMRTGRPTY